MSGAFIEHKARINSIREQINYAISLCCVSSAAGGGAVKVFAPSLRMSKALIVFLRQ